MKRATGRVFKGYTPRAYDSLAYGSFRTKVRLACRQLRRPTLWVDEAPMDAYLRTLWSQNFTPEEAAEMGFKLANQPVIQISITDNANC